jgi:hypothetical protein
MYDEDGLFSFSFSNTNNDEEININTQNGFIRNVNAGLQYSNKWNSGIHSINFSPKYNEQDYSNEKQTTNITQLGDSSLNETANVHTKLNRYNFRNSFIYDVKIDSNNSLKLTLKASYYRSESEETTDAQTAGKFGNLKNSSNRFSKISSDKNAVSGNLLFKHKFKKNQRTLSLNTDWNYLKSNGDNFLKSNNNSYFTNDTFNISIDQLTTNAKTTNKLSSKLNYTEPLSKKWALEVAYQLSLNNATNNQNTFTQSLGGIGYDAPVDSLTNDFIQNIIIHTPSAKFNYNFKKIKFNFGAGFGITNFDLLDKTSNKKYLRNYINPFPNATFVYTYKGNHALRFKYNGYNTQPTINQLQPLTNNTNFYNQFIGNPDLKPSFTNNFNITHNGYNFLKELWNYQNINLSISSNSITYDKIINPLNGATVSKPINTNGNIAASFWGGFGYKIKKIETYIELNSNLSYSKFDDVINDVVSNAQTTSAGLGFTLRKSKTDKYDLTFSNNTDLNYNTNAQTKNTNTFKTNTLTFNSKVYYKKVWSLSAEYDFFARQRLSEQVGNVNNHLVNLQLQKTFHNNEFSLYFKVKDLLNQNQSIDRSYYGNTFSEERNQRLKRYFMLGFSWDFKNKGASEKNKDNQTILTHEKIILLARDVFNFSICECLGSRKRRDCF